MTLSFTAILSLAIAVAKIEPLASCRQIFRQVPAEVVGCNEGSDSVFTMVKQNRSTSQPGKPLRAMPMALP